MKTIRFVITIASALLALSLFAQGNGKLQIHYIDVGQGDGAIVISPQGQTIMFDSGASVAPDRAAAYLEQLGITHVDYLVTSHYHADHCGCLAQTFAQVSLATAYDRGAPQKTSATFVAYVKALNAIGATRKTATPGTHLTLDETSANPVRIDFVADDGNGIATDDENDQSVEAVVHFGDFDADFGGDLSGFEHRTYHDIETSVAPKVGQVEIYKVHHHGSSHSTNQTWIDTVKPKVAIISCGDHNTYGHPTSEALETLHHAGVITYWTELGNGAEPEPDRDFISGTIVVQVPPKGESFTVFYGNKQSQTYTSWGHDSAGAPPAVPAVTTTTTNPGITYVWSKKSQVYHYAECKYCDAISADNRMSSDTPPAGKTLHQGCPH